MLCAPRSPLLLPRPRAPAPRALAPVLPNACCRARAPQRPARLRPCRPAPARSCRLHAPRAPHRVVGLAERCVAIQPPACSFSGHNTPRCIAIQNPCCQPPLLQYNRAVAQSNFFLHHFFFSFFIIIFFFFLQICYWENPKIFIIIIFFSFSRTLK